MIHFQKPARDVDRVFLHCSASDHPHHDSVEVMRKWHVEDNGWSDVGYHFFIRKDGTLEAGRPLEQTPSAQSGHNAGTIAICLHGLKADAFRIAQFDTLRKLCGEIHIAYGGDVTFHGHCEVSAKACPVFDYRQVLSLDRRGRLGGLALGVLATPEPGDMPSVATTARGQVVRVLQMLLRDRGYEPMLVVDGLFGKATATAVRNAQHELGLPVTGEVDRSLWVHLLAA